jgi:hypothetical protein
VISPNVGATSEIRIDEDFPIADINLRLELSHPNPAQLAAILI